MSECISFDELIIWLTVSLSHPPYGGVRSYLHKKIHKTLIIHSIQNLNIPEHAQGVDLPLCKVSKLYRKCNQGNRDVKNKGSKSHYGFKPQLALDEVLFGVFDDDFGLSDGESSEEEGEDVYTVKNEVCKAHKNVSIHTLFEKKCVYRDILVCMSHFSNYSVYLLWKA